MDIGTDQKRMYLDMIAPRDMRQHLVHNLQRFDASDAAAEDMLNSCEAIVEFNSEAKAASTRDLETNLSQESNDVLKATASGVATKDHSAGLDESTCEHKKQSPKTQINEISENVGMEKETHQHQDKNNPKDRERKGRTRAKHKETDRVNGAETQLNSTTEAIVTRGTLGSRISALDG